MNRQSRDLARRLIERFLACEITNDDLADNYPCREKDDRAVGAIYERLWFFWDDLHTHNLTGEHALDPEARALFERCVAFLASDLEYEWPVIKWVSVGRGFLRAIGLGKVVDKKAGQYLEKIRGFGNLDVWPFIREEDLSKSVRRVAVSE
jgi:hypothetical protein